MELKEPKSFQHLKQIYKFEYINWNGTPYILVSDQREAEKVEEIIAPLEEQIGGILIRDKRYKSENSQETRREYFSGGLALINYDLQTIEFDL